MPDAKFWDSLAAILSGMPPALAGVVIIFLCAALLVFIWRKASLEAQKERGKAEAATEKLSDHKLDTIIKTVEGIEKNVHELRVAVAEIPGKRTR